MKSVSPKIASPMLGPSYLLVTLVTLRLTLHRFNCYLIIGGSPVLPLHLFY